ncbi:hypothetical protein KPSA3_00969 [Pseudomonas syringae pv. actinidiae]|uniref:Uncharacterized protein n=1 Tax=Pseudomonas syringae pv. actinidiae TaxID=103796 RepID=A0AAN4Q1B3_PSESF|nr:hypothetical protein KPSA3_00969 [Pseudomonas syringae pv. actinidiae]
MQVVLRNIDYDFHQRHFSLCLLRVMFRTFFLLNIVRGINVTRSSL